MVSIQGVSSRSSLYHFEFEDIGLSVRVPDYGCISWADQRSVGLSFKRNRVYLEIPSQESKSLVRFMSNVVNVSVPSQVCGEGDTRYFAESADIKLFPWRTWTDYVSLRPILKTSHFSGLNSTFHLVSQEANLTRSL